MKLFNISVLFLYIFILGACTDSNNKTPIDLFSNVPQVLENKKCNISKDSLAQVEGLLSGFSKLVVLDYYMGKSYSLFDYSTGEMFGRYGTIGQGPNEIPLGCVGCIEDSLFYAFDDQTGIVVKYNIDSLMKNIDSSPIRLAKYRLPDAQISKLIPLNDSTFIGAGTYKSEYQFLLFNNYNEVLDYGIRIYNFDNHYYNKYHKFLSNQGKLVKQHGGKKFAYVVNLSSNIDFFEVNNNKIKLIKSIRLGNPIYKPIQDKIFNRVIPMEDTVIGYIDICATNEYVYALYSDEKWGKGHCNSNTVLVFDWLGNPINIYKLTQKAYYITVDDISGDMYTAAINDSGEWIINSYHI